MNLDDVKSYIQGHLSDGLVLIIGSGLSCAEGIPGMGALSSHLTSSIPPYLQKEDTALWDQVANELNTGQNLEATLLKIQLTETLESAVTEETHSYILQKESSVINSVNTGSKTLRLSLLLKHLLKPPTGIPIITTNYDRLIEISAESQGLAVNNLAVGRYRGEFNPKESRYSLCRGIRHRGKTSHLEYTDHIKILKPHGSLDWYLVDGTPVYSPFHLEAKKLIITPGINKFRDGYERPFDTHREIANKEITDASRYLIIGYGFNDDHLQVHLDAQLSKGKPAIVLTHSISPKTRNYLENLDNVWTVVSRESEDGFVLLKGKQEFIFDNINIWDLEVFVKEVLEP